jgi:hypothetical protein
MRQGTTSSRAVKLLKTHTFFLPKAYAQRSGAYKTDVFSAACKTLTANHLG